MKTAEVPAPPSPRPRPRALRTRIEGLPGIGLVTDPDAMCEEATKKGTELPSLEEVHVVMEGLSRNEDGSYGYLAWLYAVECELRPTVRSATTEGELRVVGALVYEHKCLVESLMIKESFVDHPRLAREQLEDCFDRVTDPQDIGVSMRKVAAQTTFLKKAVMFLIANSELDARLWEMLDHMQAPDERTVSRQAIAELKEKISVFASWRNAVAALLRSSQPALDRFLQSARPELEELYLGSYDFLTQFRVPEATGASLLAFEILPPGILQGFLTTICAEGKYRGYDADPKRVEILKDIAAHFGEEHCRWSRGARGTDGGYNEYVVLAIRSGDGSGEHAVAMSPRAGEHAPYVVTYGHSDGSWVSVLSLPKRQAVDRGAKKFRFGDRCDDDYYTSMRDRIIEYIENP